MIIITRRIYSQLGSEKAKEKRETRDEEREREERKHHYIERGAPQEYIYIGAEYRTRIQERCNRRTKVNSGVEEGREREREILGAHAIIIVVIRVAGSSASSSSDMTDGFDLPHAHCF